MFKKTLLSFGLFACALMAQAGEPLFNEQFEAAQTKLPSDIGWYEFINLQPNEAEIPADSWLVANGVLNIDNSADYPCTNQKWQRGLKFRNLPMKDKQLYRVSFDLNVQELPIDAETFESTPGYIDVKIMQGDENADICIQNEKGAEQRENYTLSETGEKRISKVFYFADLEKQNAAYDAACLGKENYAPQKFFTSINIYSPGKYTIDNVIVEPVNLAGVVYNSSENGAVVCVDFGVTANAAEGVKKSANGAVLDNGVVAVKVDGEAVEPISVELIDGKMYIFLAEAPDASNAVEVAFTNDGTVVFDGGYEVASFTENGTYDLSFNAEGQYVSWLITAPAVISVTPADGSFALGVEDLNTIVVTFDKPVYLTENVLAGAPTATLDNGEAYTLVTESEEGLSEVLTFKRTGELAKGTYTLKISNLVNAYGNMADDLTLSYEVGKIQLAKTEYTPICDVYVTGNDGEIPAGWSCMIGGENWTGGEAWGGGSACRNMATNGQQTFYLCDRAGYTYLMYGDQEDARLTLPAGDIEFGIIAVGHEAASRTLEFRLEDMEGNEIAKGSGETQIIAGDFTNIKAAGTISIKFNNPKEQNAILKIHEPEGGYTAARVIGFTARSYKMSAGDSVDPITYFADANFGGANGVGFEDNCAPKEGSGWAIYQDGVKRAAGANFNYNGTRLFSLGIKNLKAGYYTNGNWNNGASHYIIYGEGGEGEPVLTLPAGQLQFTYYCGLWKTNDRKLYFQILNEDNDVVYERADDIHMDKNMDGNRSANVEAVKVQFNYTIPAEGSYKIKFGGDGELFVGNISILKMPSMAAYWFQQLADVIQSAKDVMESAADPMYDGTAKNALSDYIAKYDVEDPGMTTETEYTTAIAAIVANTATLKERVTLIPAYNTAISQIGDLLGTVAGTKNEALESYAVLSEVYNKYQEVNPSSLEDDELSATVTKLQNNYALLNNMTKANGGVELLTAQLTKLAALAVAQDEELSGDEQVLAAGNAITDDQALAAQLKKVATIALYKKLAVANPFEVYDEETFETSADSLDLTGYIQNASLYTTETAATRNLEKLENLPGWNLEVTSGTPGLEFSWVTWKANEYNPVNNQFLIAGWYSEWDINQTIETLPVGKYRFVMGTQDRGCDDTCDNKIAALETHEHWTAANHEGKEGEILSYIYAKDASSNEVAAKVPFDISAQGQWYGLTDCNYKAVDVTGDITGSLLIGARAIEYQSSASVDNAKLYLIGKAEGFDYAAAAKALAEAVDGIQNVVAPAGDPVSVKYYTVDGKLTAQPKGVSIKVATWSNGFMKISKVIK